MEMTVAVQMKINNTDDGKTMIILRLQSSMKITKACQRRLTILSELNWTSKDKRNKTHTQKPNHASSNLRTANQLIISIVNDTD